MRTSQKQKRFRFCFFWFRIRNGLISDPIEWHSNFVIIRHATYRTPSRKLDSTWKQFKMGISLLIFGYFFQLDFVAGSALSQFKFEFIDIHNNVYFNWFNSVDDWWLSHVSAPHLFHYAKSLISCQHNWHASRWGSVGQSIVPSSPQSWYLVAWTVLPINPWKMGSMQPMIL